MQTHCFKQTVNNACCVSSTTDRRRRRPKLSRRRPATGHAPLDNARQST